VPQRLPIGIVGGTGYVSGELLRLLATHPSLKLGSIASVSQTGTPVAQVFPNLASCVDDVSFASVDELESMWRDGGLRGLFCATPHGAAAPVIARLLEGYGGSGRVVDISADFRFRDVRTFREIYGQDHGAPQLADEFFCAVPEHSAPTPARHAAHPGCFATAMLLGIVPLLRSGLTDGPFHIAGVTGSTGSGRSPLATTHHPERHSNLYAYRPLNHRHAPEVRAIALHLTGEDAAVQFVPHSGPFARGIHITIQGSLARSADGTSLLAALKHAYEDRPFVEVVDTPPRIKDVVGSNRARITATAEADCFAVMVVLDNLVKGAAGGAMQWMNRLLHLDERAGLTIPGPAWI
jgi:N-acetyl-gamma-glutamyl-phosphate reductase